MRPALLATLLVLLGVSPPAPAAAVHPFPRLPASCSRSDYTSGGAGVRAAVCRPAAPGRAPVAIVLHGCGGFDTFDHRLAVELPRAGIATLYVDYFGPTPPPGDKGFCSGARGSFRNVFATWQREVAAAVAHLRLVRGVDPHRVVLVGWSLGGGLAVSAALEHPGLYRAVVGFSTGIYGGEPAVSLAHMPPTLILSGGPHDAIPLSASESLYRALRAAGVRASLYDYGDGVHRWPGAQGTAGIAVAERFLRRVLG